MQHQRRRTRDDARVVGAGGLTVGARGHLPRPHVSEFPFGNPPRQSPPRRRLWSGLQHSPQRSTAIWDHGRHLEALAGGGGCAAAAEVDDLHRGLAEMERRRVSFLRSSGGTSGPGSRRPSRTQPPAYHGIRPAPGPSSSRWGATSPARRPTDPPGWEPMREWLSAKGEQSAAATSGFVMEPLCAADFADCCGGEVLEARLSLRNVSGGSLRVRLRRQPSSPFALQLVFPSGPAVAAGLSAVRHGHAAFPAAVRPLTLVLCTRDRS